MKHAEGTLPAQVQNDRILFYKNYLPIKISTFGSFWSQENFATHIPNDENNIQYYEMLKDNRRRAYPAYQREEFFKVKTSEQKLGINNYADKNNMIKYYINDHDFRCDQFKKNHDKKHILFSGCSITFGVGVDYEKTWAKKVYNELNKNHEYDGYFNIAIPGASVIEIVGNIFQYIREYGNPEIIFILLPNFGRDTRYTHEKIYVFEDNTHIDNNNIYLKLGFYAYLSLDQYCRSNNIKLIVSSWSHNNFDDGFVINKTEDLSKSFFNFFDTYRFVDIELFYNDIEEYITNNNDSYLGEDNKHPGSPIHHAWFKFMIKEFYK